jgi:formate C-acetyltransferase
MLDWVNNMDSTADDQRAKIVTECYDKYAACTPALRWALTLRELYERLEIHIWPEELIVGELAAKPNSAPLYPEFSVDWLADEFLYRPMEERTNDRYVISEEVKRTVFDLLQPFWKGKTVSEAIIADYSEEEKKGNHLGKGVVLDGLYVYAGVGHVCADYAKLFRLGWKGIRAQVRARLAALDTSKPEDAKKRDFYLAEDVALDGASTYIRRYGELAARMAAEEKDEDRRKELERVSANCLWVSENPPRDFWEAIQLWHIATNMIIIESNGHSVTYGRFDQLFYPFYKKDMETGNLSREKMQELIEHAFVKMHELRKIRDTGAIIFSSGTIMGGTALDVGGVDEEGNDAVNDLSYMVLDAHAHTRIPNPGWGCASARPTRRNFGKRPSTSSASAPGSPRSSTTT